MSSRQFDILDISAYGIVGVATALAVVAMLSRPSKLDAIPMVGSTGWLHSWWAGLKYPTNAADVIQEGYDKYKSAPYRVATLYHWLVVLNGREHIEELWKAPIDTFSSAKALEERFQLDYTVGPEIHSNPYHLPILRSRLTRNLGALYPEVRDEITHAFDDVLGLNGNGWKSVPALSSVQQVICRTSNRVFVGLPLCRDPDWISLNVQYTVDVVKGSAIVTLFPKLLKPIAVWLFTGIGQSKQRARELLDPIIQERQRCLVGRGPDRADKPGDLLSWLMEEAKGPELSVESLTTRILFINFAAIHTTASSLTHALFYLAESPQYIRPLREEVESVVKEGWSKAALDKMRKVDSFLKECQRIEGVACVTLQRKALKDFTFPDGMFVPKGTRMATAARSVHCNEALYENAHAFDPFRFACLNEDSDGAKHQYVSTSADYLPFGHGRQSCPGRFFAVNELKAMLAHIVVTYDIKLEDHATRPQPSHLATSILPDPCARIMFRRRVD